MQPSVPGQGKGQAGDFKPTQWAQADLEGVKGKLQGGAACKDIEDIASGLEEAGSTAITQVDLQGSDRRHQRFGQEASSRPSRP